MNALLIALAVLAGVTNPVQSAANAGLHKALGQVLPAILCIYAIAFVALLLCAPFLGISFRGLGAKAAEAPWWAWLGGLCNLLFVLTASVATQKLGSAVFTVTAACVAVILSLALDRFGLLGLAPHPLTWVRILGGFMAVGSIVLVAAS